MNFNTTPTGRSRKQDMVAVPGGTFLMGSDHHYPEEAPARPVRVDGFWMDATPVTVGQFAEFVAATGYVTLAEIAPDVRDYPNMPPEMAQPGSLVFEQTAGPVNLADISQWWQFRFGANWRCPWGDGDRMDELRDHPVVHVAHADALAYARWAGKTLPTEAEWERAARGGLAGREFAWGDTLSPGGTMMANLWQGRFPHENRLDDGWERTSPVRSFPPNDFGLYDMIGNVWEWTADWYGVPSGRRAPKAPRSCCAPSNPRGATRKESFDLANPSPVPRKVLKGGSHLCAPNYCQRYRPAARHAQPIDSATSHIGFRCILRGK